MQRLRSLRHRFWYGVSERVRWSRGTFYEIPARQLPTLAYGQAQRIAALRSRYQVKFELLMSAPTAANNYEYLDILDRAWSAAKSCMPSGGVLCDIGCASFWYVAALDAFFRPRELIGIEIEGHRLFRDGRTRIDYANGYLSAVPSARFLVADYLTCELAADVITAWFPFLTPTAILAWRLPLSMLQPQRLMHRIYHNLNPRGVFVMVNHGQGEAALAANLCIAAGFRRVSRFEAAGLLSGHRKCPAVLTCWTRS